MAYTKQTWANDIVGGTPISAARLNHIENGIENVDVEAAVNVKSPRFAGGAKGDDATDDSAAIQAAITYAATLGDPDTPGATVFFPPGTYRIGTTCNVPSSVRLLGAGREATTIRRTANVSVFTFHGTDTPTRNWYCALEHMTFAGGDFSASCLDFVYVSQFQMDHVSAYACTGSFLDLTEVWDSSFSNVFTDWVGSGTHPAIWIRNSRATSGFGYSSDNSNQLKFLNLHCETFPGTAIRIESGTNNTAPPNGIYFNVVKCESSQVTTPYPFIYISAECRGVYFDKVYCSVNAFAAGSSTGINVIENNSNGQVSLTNIMIASANVTPTLVDAGIQINTTGVASLTTVNNVIGDFGQPPISGLIRVPGAGGLHLDHLNCDNGTLISGFEMEVQQRMLTLPADITTTSTTIVDMAGLKFWDAQEGTYTLTFEGIYQSSVNTAYPRIGFGGTATTTTPIIGRVTNHTSTTASTTGVITAANTGHTGANASAATTNYQISGWFTFTVTAPGAIVLRWYASTASTQTMLGGSWALLARSK
jgi:hypothetical protein